MTKISDLAPGIRIGYQLLQIEVGQATAVKPMNAEDALTAPNRGVSLLAKAA